MFSRLEYASRYRSLVFNSSNFLWISCSFWFNSASWSLIFFIFVSQDFCFSAHFCSFCVRLSFNCSMSCVADCWKFSRFAVLNSRFSKETRIFLTLLSIVCSFFNFSSISLSVPAGSLPSFQEHLLPRRHLVFRSHSFHLDFWLFRSLETHFRCRSCFRFCFFF